MNFSLECTGGMGFHIMFSSLIRWLNEKYPKSKINVISAYPELFEYNPRIYRNLRLDQPYLFEDYIKKTDYRTGSPYQMHDFYHKRMHMMKLLPKAFGFNDYNQKPQSEIFFTKGEEIDGQIFNKQNMPLLTFQMCGGLPMGVQPSRMKLDSIQRDLPFKFAIKVAQSLLNKGFHLLQIRSESEPRIPGTIQIQLPFRNILPIIKHSIGHVGIDSSGMHGAAIFKKPQLIFWGQTHKDNLGYNYPKVLNIFNEHGMHYRPQCQMPDREGMFPYKSKNEGLEFDYTDSELDKFIKKFIDSLK